MLLNRHAKGWLAAAAVVGGAAVLGIVPWSTTLALGVPLVVPRARHLLFHPEPRSLSRAQLEHVWWSSSLALQAPMTVESRMALVAEREAILTEILRRGGRRGRAGHRRDQEGYSRAWTV